ncbi:MAG: metal-dependent hydrolase [Acidobacteria bacterium]|nr:metal-dependent hydrolase [Acidobacteriota bacterium]
MDNLTHSLFALTLARTPLRRAGHGTTLALVLASNAPDLDIVSAFAGGSASYLAQHRGPTHGLLGIVGLGILVAGVVRLAERRAKWKTALGVATLGVLLHVMMDLATSYGTRVLSPFDDTWYAIDLMPIIDVYLLFALAAGLLAMRWQPQNAPRIAAIVLCLIGVNYAARSVLYRAALGEANTFFSNEVPSCPAPFLARWSSRPAGPADASDCAPTTALPSFVSPFQWRVIRRVAGGYQRLSLDLLNGRASPTDHILDADTREVALARHAPIARVFLGFARLPTARADREPHGRVAVRWTDLRFVGGLSRVDADEDRVRGPFGVLVRLDADGRVLEQRLGQ